MDAWFGRRAARRLADAAGATERWSRAGTQLDVIRAYYAAVLGAEQVTTLDSAARAAHAHERQAESQHRNGTATKSDALLAAVRAGEVDTRRVAALGAARLARRRLALALGSVDDTAFVLPTQLPDATKLVALAGEPATAAPGERADIRAASFVVEATKAEHRRATALLLPRLDAFGRLDWTTDGAPFGGQEAWTVGVMLRWSPFSGGAELAQRREAYAQSAAAAATLEAVEAQGRLELEEAATALETALARMAISERAVGQSAEAHRIVSRKYDGGLATAVELFDAAAEETSARLGFADARYEVITSLAQRRRAAGLDAGTITELDESER
jgi:outer membrane protein TolC